MAVKKSCCFDLDKIQSILEEGYIGVEFKANKEKGISHILFQKGKYLNERG